MYMFRLAYGSVSFFNVRFLYKLYHRHHPTKLTPTPSFYANTHAPFSLKGQHFPPNNLLVIYNRLLIIKKCISDLLYVNTIGKVDIFLSCLNVSLDIISIGNTCLLVFFTILLFDCFV